MSFTTLTIGGSVTDAAGTTQTWGGSCTATLPTDTITVSSVAVSPVSAPQGTSRTLTVVATSSTGSALTFNTPTATGITFTPVAGSPGQWTFVY